jgi:hypothetical protein
MIVAKYLLDALRQIKLQAFAKAEEQLVAARGPSPGLL